MTTLALTITDAGRAAIVNATNTGAGPVVLSQIALGSATYAAPSTSQTALVAEVKRISTFGADVVADDIIHITITDTSPDIYTLGEFGIYTDTGALFAVYSQTTPILEKGEQQLVLLSADILLTSVPPGSVTIGGAEFMLPPATTARQGVVELATVEEVQAGTDAARVVTPAGLASRTATEERHGLVELATATEVQAGTDTGRAVTPAGLSARFATTDRRGLVELATSGEAAALADSTRALTAAALEAALGELFAGSIAYFASSSAPAGWLKANGTTVSRTTYARLFSRIGTTFGAGDGSTTFDLPDLRGEFVRGLDDGRGVDAGRALGSAQADDLKSHAHSLGYQSGTPGGGAFGVPTVYATPNKTDGVVFSTGGTETRPRNIALLACIKY